MHKLRRVSIAELVEKQDPDRLLDHHHHKHCYQTEQIESRDSFVHSADNQYYPIQTRDQEITNPSAYRKPSKLEFKKQRSNLMFDSKQNSPNTSPVLDSSSFTVAADLLSLSKLVLTSPTLEGTAPQTDDLPIPPPLTLSPRAVSPVKPTPSSSSHRKRPSVSSLLDADAHSDEHVQYNRFDSEYRFEDEDDAKSHSSYGDDSDDEDFMIGLSSASDSSAAESPSSSPKAASGSAAAAAATSKRSPPNKLKFKQQQQQQQSSSSSQSKTTNNKSSSATCRRNSTTGVREKRKCDRWNEELDNKLKEAIEVYGARNWKAIAKYVGNGKQANQCHQHYHRVISPAICKDDWTQEERDLLLYRIKTYGTNSWTLIAEGIPGRIDSQCRQRWLSMKKTLPREELKEIERVTKINSTLARGGGGYRRKRLRSASFATLTTTTTTTTAATTPNQGEADSSKQHGRSKSI